MFTIERKKVIIVEDDPLNLKLFQDLLEIKNIEVFPIQKPDNFLYSVLEIEPHLILMDVQLQNISGLSLVRELKANSNTMDIPVIVITAYATKDDQEKILEAGAESYISKPIAIDYFYSTIGNYLEKESVVKIS